jgi:hypothetical protein
MTPSQGDKKCELEVKPLQQPRINLGEFTANNPPKGFVIKLTPDPDPPESVVTQIVSLGTDKKYKLILHIANYGSKVLHAKIKPIE